MRVLFLKEISGFFSSLTGYIIITIFLTVNSLILWVLPSDLNILDSGYASLDSFFLISPWIFLFLVPAVTMRSFSDEKRNGTMELLLTKPLTELQIVLAKFFGAVVLVMLSILPCLVFYWSVSVLANPQGNLDNGSVLGAFLGLFFLAAIYVSIGIFTSALTDNQVVSFILAVLVSLLFFQGFEWIAVTPGFQNFDFFIVNIGINEHYKSISRGVIDSRDIVYYLVLVFAFVWGTRIILKNK